MKIYLASGSPRRKTLLRQARIRFTLVKPDYEEKNENRLVPSVLTKKHALGKALSVASKVKMGVIISADTVIFFKGKILGKPKTKAYAFKMLGNLCGHWHDVVTGVALLKVEKGQIVKKSVFSVKSRVYLNYFNTNEIKHYFLKVNPMDKAGAYAAQSQKPGIVGKVRGSFSNVVGLPMEKLKKELNVLK